MMDVPEILECESCGCIRELSDFDQQIEEVPNFDEPCMDQFFVCPICGDKTFVGYREFTEEEVDFYYEDEPSQREWEDSILREYYRMCL